MMTPDTTREALLQQELTTLRTENETLKAQNEQLRQHNAVLRLKVDAMARKLFGKSSEKLDPEQLQMVFDAMEAGPLEEAKKSSAATYLTDIFRRLPTETNQTVQRLTPRAWAAEQALKGQSVTQSTVVPT